MDAADHIQTPELSLALGDSLFVEEEYTEALNAYAIGLTLLSSDNRGVDNSKIIQFRCHSHKAAAHLKLGQPNEALGEFEAALSLIPIEGCLRLGETERVYYRQGQVLMDLNRHEKAKDSFDKAKQLAELNQRDTAEKYMLCSKKCSDIIDAGNEEDVLIVEELDKKAPKISDKIQKKESVPTMPKYQYYQSDKFMTISILESNVKPDQMNVSFRTKHLTVIMSKQGQDFTVVCGKLYDKVIVDRCKVVCKEDKVLVKLRKLETNYEWQELFGKKSLNGDSDDEMDDKPSSSSNNTNSAPKTRPYASHRDWNAIERDLKQQEKKEKPEGEQAMTALFEQIYASADEDTKRAMIKSYQTSGGTVLSTNWDEVKGKDYEKEKEAPKGMEWKTWEGDKV